MHSWQTQLEVAALLDRYLIGLDTDTLDDAWARNLFTEDAVVEFPMSTHKGIDGLAAYHRESLGAFASTQHLGSPATVDALGEDRAHLRANVLTTHEHRPGSSDGPHFTAGTLATGEALRTSVGWRLASLSFRVVWTAGTPPRKETR